MGSGWEHGEGADAAWCGGGSSAEDLVTNDRVAIKKIANPFNQVTDTKRLLREIKLQSVFKHENVRARGRGTRCERFSVMRPNDQPAADTATNT